ncbi:MAG: hypothetical protein A2148_03630 [Chloroflexi bacterium RBG_16_68_14]|nr:MAG: hypothetical protein A2148_03630 [Chloroflexi bacterium RBG_16_68_14]
MNQIVGTCPVCGDEMRVVRLRCRGCETALDGSFELTRLLRLAPEQLYFAETFIRNRGKIKDVEGELGISYPTVVARLDDVITSLGYEAEHNEEELRESRRQILDELSEGRIDASEAAKRLRELQVQGG